MSEPKGRGVAWTEERGTSDEGRRCLKAARRRAGDRAVTFAMRASGMVVIQMYAHNEVVRERLHSMLAEAAAERQALRVRALGRADRRAERAQRRLVRSRRAAVRLRSELAAEQGS